MMGAVYEQETRLTTVEGGKKYRQIILEFSIIHTIMSEIWEKNATFSGRAGCVESVIGTP
jgi:hypothetical protein